MDNIRVSSLQATAHQNAVDAGWWEDEVQFGTKIALMHSELSEALEADRAGNRYPTEDVGYVYAIEDTGEFRDQFKQHVKDTVFDELADTVIRILDLSGNERIDLETHILAKMRYNKTRGYKHGGKNY